MPRVGGVWIGDTKNFKCGLVVDVHYYSYHMCY